MNAQYLSDNVQPMIQSLLNICDTVSHEVRTTIVTTIRSAVDAIDELGYSPADVTKMREASDAAGEVFYLHQSLIAA